MGKELHSLPMTNQDDYHNVRYKHQIWHEYNIEMLRRIFDNEDLSKEYAFWGVSVYSDVLREQIRYLSEDISTHVTRLESIRERLPLYPEQPGISNVTLTARERTDSTTKSVFLVHGSDHGVKETVARYLAKLNLDPIVLHEQPNLGDTIIEKLERSSPVAFSIVLLTCDDQAYPVSNPSSLKFRARQNVVFELGYFIGKLGRQKVCALYADGVELPSDFQGVVYIPLDKAGAWRLLLARELKASGLNIDLNDVL